MKYENIIDELDVWLDDAINSYIDDTENEDLKLEDVPDLHIEKFEHAFIIRWGSRRGNFPTLTKSYLTNKHYIVQSGEMANDKVLRADDNSKIEFNMEQLVYRYLLEDQMEGCENGYVIAGVGIPSGTDRYKITVVKV